MKLFAAVLSVVLTISVPTLVLAKGDTVKITIESTDLPAPIEITIRPSGSSIYGRTSSLIHRHRPTG